MAVTAPTVTSQGPRLWKVKTLSGQEIEVQGTSERDFYRGQQTKYQAENSFTATTDLQDLDRLIFMELMTYRNTCWLASGKNYYSEMLGPSEEADCRRAIKENAPLISNVKNDLGLTKAQRDKEQFESVGKYLVDLKARAREHGINRENQLQKAIVLMNQLFSVVGAFDRADETERGKLGLETSDDVLDWIRDVMRPEFDSVDAYFRANQQKFWVRKL